MSSLNTTYALAMIVIAIVTMISALCGLAAGLVARHGGATLTRSVQHGGAAFVSTLTVMLATLTLLSVWLD